MQYVIVVCFGDIQSLLCVDMFPMLERGSVKLQKFGQTMALRYQREQERKRRNKIREQNNDTMAVG